MTGRIHDRLVGYYGQGAVFRDIDDIPYGVDFQAYVDEVLQKADLLIAVVGPGWMGRPDLSRIREPKDPVRIEIETALRRKMAIIPVLVEGARMPAAEELPDSLREFAFRNAADVDAGKDFQRHMDRLIRSIDHLLGARPDDAVKSHNIELYVSIDLSRQSPLVRALFSGIAAEATQAPVKLTSTSIDGPASFTPNMRSWYAEHVERVRKAAVEEIIDEFSAHPRGILFEAERDRIELTASWETQREIEAFRGKLEVQSKSLMLSEIREAYDNLAAQHGRDALVQRPVLYWGVLGCIGAANILINWPVFAKLSQPGPFVLGVRLLIAFTLLASADLIGRLVKQRRALFADFAWSRERKEALRDAGLGAMFLLAAMTAILGAHGWIADGITSLSAVLANLAVYLLAAGWSFVRHDEVPGFSELRGMIERLEHDFRKFRATLMHRIEPHRAKVQQSLSGLRRQEERQAEEMEGYAALRRRFALLQQKDDELLTVLNEYRSLLNQQLEAQRSGRPAYQFVDPSISLLDRDPVVRWTTAEYRSVSLRMPYCV